MIHLQNVLPQVQHMYHYFWEMINFYFVFQSFLFQNEPSQADQEPMLQISQKL